MPFLFDYVTLDIVFAHDGQQARCRLYANKTAGPIPYTQATLNTFVNALQTTLAVSLLPCLSAAADYVGIELRAFEGGNEFEAFSTGATASGTNTGDMLPEECSVVLQRRTGKIGRSKRGRIYFPFVSDGDTSDSTLTLAAVNRFKTLCTALNTPFVGGGYTFSPRTPDFKNSLMENVIQVRVLSEIMSRRQRRAPKRPLVFAP